MNYLELLEPDKNQIQKKVLAYILNDKKLLIFDEPEFPEIGFQVPGGTVEEDENIFDAVIRESQEETGISTFEIISYLGQKDFFVEKYNLRLNRHFFLLKTNEKKDETWEHTEKFNSIEDTEILFRFKWVELKDMPVLLAEQDSMIEKVFEYLKN